MTHGTDERVGATVNTTLSARPEPGRIWPSVPALVVIDGDDGVRLVNAARGEVTSATGTFAPAMMRSIRTGRREPLLGALGAESPLGRSLAELEGQPHFPLTAAQALRLDGFDTLFVEVTAACNQQCLHCYAASGPGEAARLSRATCESVLGDARALGFRRVQLTGGEPLLCEFLPELVARTWELGIAECEIFTNGLLLDQRMLETLAPHRPSLAFSVYSHDASTHDSITGVADSHRRTLAAIERALGAGLAVRVAVVSMQNNQGHEAATVDHVTRLGVPRVGVTGARAVGRGETCGCGFVPGSTTDAGPVQARASGTLCVASDGSVYPCIFNRTDRVGSVLERSLGAIAEAPEVHPATDSLDRALSLALERLQCASCRLTACALFACAEVR